MFVEYPGRRKWFYFPYEKPYYGELLYVVYRRSVGPTLQGPFKYVCELGLLGINKDRRTDYMDGYEICWERDEYVINTFKSEIEPRYLFELDNCYWAYKKYFPNNFKNVLNSWSGSHARIDKRIDKIRSGRLDADDFQYSKFQQCGNYQVEEMILEEKAVELSKFLDIEDLPSGEDVTNQLIGETDET